jgi:hypothetical protein
LFVVNGDGERLDDFDEPTQLIRLMRRMHRNGLLEGTTK